MIKVYDWIQAHNNRIPDKLAMIDWHSSRRFTYSEMNSRVVKLAGFMQHDLKVKKGDRIAVLGFNSSDIFEIQFACFRIGAIFVPLNLRLAIPELEFMINDLEANVFFHGPEFKETALKLQKQCNIGHLVEFNGEGKESEFENSIAGAEPVYEKVEQFLEDTCTILYTSGTTGRPKGACITHASVLFNAVNTSTFGRINQDSGCLCILPMFHVSGLNIFGNPVFHAGGTNVVIRNIVPSLLLNLINDKTLKISHFIAVPTIYQFMAACPEFNDTDFSRVVMAVVGGAPAPESLLTTYSVKAVKLCNAYGMTETGPAVLAPDRDDAMKKIGSVGRPVIHVDIKLMSKDGKDVQTGETGEIWVKGPAVINEYWNRPEANKTDFTDGWLHTGDAAYCDTEGDYYIVDRWKDMYISGGENVYPAEVENVISMMPEVMMTAVLGVPDEKWGETGAAFIVLKENCSLDEDKVKQYCLENLAKYKVPSKVCFVPELPLNATGKIVKIEMKKAEWWKQYIA